MSIPYVIAVLLVKLLLSKFKHPASEIILVSFVSLIYVYMLRLIRDVDDPLEYSPDGRRRRGCAEVDLSPLLEYQQRVQERLTSPVPPTAPPAARSLRRSRSSLIMNLSQQLQSDKTCDANLQKLRPMANRRERVTAGM